MPQSIGLAVACLLCVARGFTQPALILDPTVRPLWRTTQATVGTPAIDGNDVFALTADHQLVKVSLDEGSELWRVKTGEEGFLGLQHRFRSKARMIEGFVQRAGHAGAEQPEAECRQ